ncbi:MAG: hypothetical protein AAF725_15880 [Acidobacteriota bacterium]
MTWILTSPWSLRARFGIFAASALALGLFSLFALSSAQGLAHEEARAVAWGVTADLALLAPALYWLLVVRAGAPRLTLVPVAILGWAVASAIVPAEHRQGLALLEALALPAGVWVAGSVAVRAGRSYREALSCADVLEGLEARAARLVGSGRVAAALAHESALLYYALASWRKRPAGGAGTFTHHRQELFMTLSGGMMLATIAEIVPVHLLVGRWSETAAWVLTALSAYGLFWMLGDARAVALRTSTWSAGTLHLRVGLRGSADLPLNAISSVTSLPPAGPGLTPEDGYVKMNLVGQPKLLLTLSSEVEVRGAYGVRRSARFLGITVDQQQEFLSELRGRREDLALDQ